MGEIVDPKVANGQRRCGVCGKFHPFIAVCPYVSESTLIIERQPNGRMSRRIQSMKYFPRPELAEQSIDSLDEAKQLADAEKEQE